MSDVKVTLYDGSYHDVDSSEMAFKIAGSIAIKEAAGGPNRCCSSRSWRSKWWFPKSTWATVIGDLISAAAAASRAWSCAVPRSIIKAMVPLSEMFGYATDVRSRTQGRGSFTMHFGKYEEVPGSLAEEIVSKVQGKTTK